MSAPHQPIKALLFDWGDTLMVDFPQYKGAMVEWPVVQAVPGALELLAALSGRYKLAIATNAVDSDESAIRAALERVGISQLIERIYCQRSIGFAKPSAEYFTHVLNDLKLEAGEVIMVGDSFSTDILGAVRCGLRAVWLNRRTLDEQTGKTYSTIHELSQLLPLLQKWNPAGSLPA